MKQERSVPLTPAMEKAVNELQHLTGLGEQLEEPPAILETDIRGVLRNDA